MKFFFILLCLIFLSPIARADSTTSDTPSTTKTTPSNGSTADEDAEALTQAFQNAKYDNFKNKNQTDSMFTQKNR